MPAHWPAGGGPASSSKFLMHITLKLESYIIWPQCRRAAANLKSPLAAPPAAVVLHLEAQLLHALARLAPGVVRLLHLHSKHLATEPLGRSCTALKPAAGNGPQAWVQSFNCSIEDLAHAGRVTQRVSMQLWKGAATTSCPLLHWVLTAPSSESLRGARASMPRTLAKDRRELLFSSPVAHRTAHLL